MNYDEITEAIHKSVSADINTLDGAVKLLKESQPLLKETATLYGLTDNRTTDLATLIAQKVINITISDINSASRHLITQTKSEPENKPALLDTYLKHLSLAEMIISVLYKLPVSDEFKAERIEPQNQRLKSLIKNTEKAKERCQQKPVAAADSQREAAAGATEQPNRDERPRKRHTLGWFVVACIVLVIGYAAICIIDTLNEKSKLADIEANYTEEGIMAYLSDNDNTHYCSEAVKLYLSNMDSILLNPQLMAQPRQYPPLVRMDNFSRNASLSPETQEMITQRVRQRSDSLYNIALKDNTIEAWYWFQSLAPTQYYHDSNQRIDSLQSLAWSAEPSAWQLALTNDDRQAYSQYIELYPHGEHQQEAESKLIDIEVNAYKNRSNTVIKSIDWLEAYPGDKSMVYILNKTGHDMQFWFSGPTSCKMSVATGKSGSVRLDNGSYRILVIISGLKNDRFTFTQDFESAIYSSSITMDD